MIEQKPKFMTNVPQNENKNFEIHIAIDFGTDGVGLAYCDKENTFIHDRYESSRFKATVKPKTILLLDEEGN